MSDYSRNIRRPATRSDPEIVARLRRPAAHGSTPVQIVLASATAVFVLVALLWLTWVRSIMAERVASPLADKLADAERVSYYIVPEQGEERAPTFRLGPGDTSLKLITHMVLPPGHDFRAEEDFAYGIRLTLSELDGAPIWDHEINVRTRQSKKDWGFSGWRYENAFLLADPESPTTQRELTDDRLTRVRLPDSEGDRLLRLTFVPREPSVGAIGLARAYVRRRRAVDDRTLRDLSVDPETARALVDHLTYREWDQLSDAERRAKLSYVWERMAAEGEAGPDYELLSIYETHFRLPRNTKVDERRLVVDATRSLAVNVLGEAELTLEAFGAPELLSQLAVTRLGLDGSVSAYPSSRASARTIVVPPGVHTLIIECAQPVELSLEVSEAQVDRVWLIEADRPMRVDEDGQEVLEPDVRRIQVVRLGEHWHERPRWAIVGPDDALSRTFRFDVRIVHPRASQWWEGRGPAPEVELCFLDADAAELGCERWAGDPAIRSHFEGLRLGDQAVDEDNGDMDTRWYAVAEPQTLRLVAPDEAAFVEMRAPEQSREQRLIVRGYGYWPEVETELGEPFRLYRAEDTIWRYPPLDTRTWFPLRPDNYDELQDDKAIADLLAQVRLQHRGMGAGDDEGSGRRGWRGDPDIDDRLVSQLDGEDGWDPGPWVTLEPRGIHRRRLILEQLDDEAGRRFPSRWDPSLFTELWSGRVLSMDLGVELGAVGSSAPELHWQVDPRTLGRSVKLTVDGRAFEHVVAEARGRWRLPIEAQGRARVELEFEADKDEYDMWMDRPVLVASPPVSRRRAVHELTKTLVFELHKPDFEAVTVNVVVYIARRRERAELVLSVDGGAPQRRTGVPIDKLSVAEREYTIDEEGGFNARGRQVDVRAPIRFVDLEARQGLALDVVTVTVTLGEDIVPGDHEVSVELLDGGRVWIRAFHRGVADRSKSATSWTEAVEPSEEPEP